MQMFSYSNFSILITLQGLTGEGEKFEHCLSILSSQIIFFKMWAIFKVCIEFVAIFLPFYIFWVLCHEVCVILAPQPGIEPASSTLEGKVLTTGPPG